MKAVRSPELVRLSRRLEAMAKERLSTLTTKEFGELRAVYYNVGAKEIEVLTTKGGWIVYLEDATDRKVTL